MATSSNRPPKQQRGRAASAVRGASWMSLLAATTLGISAVGHVRARISAEADVSGGSDDYRLIVQSYSRSSLDEGKLPDAYARPQASVQRAVTPEELQDGIDVQILQLGDEVETSEGDRVVVAWVEQGKPDLPYDARRARPAKGAYYGIADDDADQGVRIVLRRQTG